MTMKKFRIIPVGLDSWGIETWKDSYMKPVSKTVFDSSFWTGRKERVVHDYVPVEGEWVPVHFRSYTGGSHGRLEVKYPVDPYASRFTRFIETFPSKDHCKDLIDVVLERDRADKERQEAIACRLANTPPEEYP